MTTTQAATVRLTHDFRRHAKRAKVSNRELNTILATLAQRPDAGVIIPGTDGARKVRFAGRGKGKRGGYRVITCTVLSTDETNVYLLDIYTRSDKVDLSRSERNTLREIVKQIRISHAGKQV